MQSQSKTFTNNFFFNQNMNLNSFEHLIALRTHTDFDHLTRILVFCGTPDPEHFKKITNEEVGGSRSAVDLFLNLLNAYFSFGLPVNFVFCMCCIQLVFFFVTNINRTAAC